MEPSYVWEDLLDDPSLLYISSPPQQMHMEWTFEEDKLFENCLAEFDISSVDLIHKITSKMVGRTMDEIKQHYEALVEDVENIESGSIPLLDYKPMEINEKEKMLAPAMHANYSYNLRRRKGVPWTKEEHEKFLFGLEKYGKGDWRSISRYCVQTRNPTQVASHAQKHFIRLEKSKGCP